MTANNDELTFQLGDKVRVKFGEYKGQRGIVVALNEEQFTIALVTGASAQLANAELTNYSLAARRAWQKMPKKAGRPLSKKPRKKMVSMRLDTDLWIRLSKAVELGYVPNREEAINRWVKENLDELNIESEEDKT